MKKYMKDNIVNVEIQNQKSRHAVVPPFLYGGYNNIYNGMLLYGDTGLMLKCNEETLEILYECIESVELSFLFRRNSSRTLPENACYIDILIVTKEKESYELNSLNYDEVKNLYNILQSKQVRIYDSMNVIQLLQINDKEDEFYYYMRDHGKEIAKEYDLEYPKYDSKRTK